MEVLRKRKVLPDLVLKVRDVRAAPIPSYLLSIRFLLRVAGNLHAVVEHRVRFIVIQDVEFDRQSSSRVLHPKVKPLCVPMSIDVILHQTVVFLVAHLRCQKQVPTFKSAFKDQRSIFFVLKFVASAPIPTVFDKASIAQLVEGL